MSYKTTNLKKTVIARALMVAFGTAVLAVGVNPTARAQSNATGTLFGQVEAGSSVVLTNKATATKRTITPDATGRFTAPSLTTGMYRVDVVKGGTTTQSSDDIEVRIGQGTEVVFASSITSVKVTGRAKQIDVSNVGTTTVFTANDLAKIPVATNVQSIIQLAPNTTRGDSRYGGGTAPSFGGSAASENASYINGFPVTTLLTQVGFAQLPFNSIAQAQILTGGYGAEFGRSTGGVTNIVTKSGSNQAVAGFALSYEPDGLRARSRNQYFENNGGANDGKLRLYNRSNKTDQVQESVYVGGAFIKDKLFFFLSAENTKTTLDSVRTLNNGALSATAQATAFQERFLETPRYLGKLDWNITDNHHLEYTKLDDTVRDDRKFFGFNYNTLQRTGVQRGGQTYENWGPTPVAAQQGAELDILKYTGYLTDDLTVTALVGRTKTKHSQIPDGYNPALAQTSVTSPAFAPAALGTVNNPQTIAGTILAPGAFDKNTGGRLDFEWKALPTHTIRGGVDKNRIVSLSGQSTAGGALYTYKLDAARTDGKPPQPVDAQTANPRTVPGPYSSQGFYVERSVSNTLSTPTVEQTAAYIEDRWQVTPRLLLSLGLRNEGFDNKNGDGKSYIKLSTQLAPRLGAVWDVNGDASLKAFANLGRYHVPLPTNVAIRAAGSSLNAQQNFTYTGIDANGVPTGITAISPFYSNNNELGQAKDPKSVAAENMKGNYQDEIAFGFEKALTKDWNVGAKATYRTLRTAIDDHCDDRPFLAYAARNNINTTNFPGYNCALFNPGIGNTFNIDLNGDGTLERVPLSAADLGIPKVKRTYTALDLFAEHQFDGKWYAKVLYTLARNAGNTEGQTLSDIGQADVSTTQAYDYPEFSVNANGLLPNDRKHQLKVFGFYSLTSEYGFGGNLLAASGRPKNCIGNAPDPVGSTAPGAVTNYSGYGSAYFFCNGLPSPRGSQGRLPSDIRVDLNAAYKPGFFPGAQLKLDVFNVFNRQATQTIEERRYVRNSTAILPAYNAVESYTAARSVKITASYDYKF